uniref:Uncharacterized protein n=1 Tax=Anguilla anguilla TaxID=7936 RepID=A0A0E9S0H4_ANGAN
MGPVSACSYYYYAFSFYIWHTSLPCFSVGLGRRAQRPCLHFSMLCRQIKCVFEIRSVL